MQFQAGPDRGGTPRVARRIDAGARSVHRGEMRGPRVVALVMALGCGPKGSSETDSGSGGSGSTTAASEATGPTTGSAPEPLADMGDGLAEHGPCPRGDECELCLQTPDGSVCGPPCDEFGPGPAPGRCPLSPVQSQSICPVLEEGPWMCVILCGEDAHCPDPGMRCVDCPEAFALGCKSLSGFAGTGPQMCVWPG
ncbi:hypothetical protein SAMN02745121_05178 [Nannocystis exedens]|uniref:Uncharacterized protein n=2 Tax=Nannocystis exedens TaxID=54 RepID=A0A1I2CK12_9BACT|nr:hypothetical protein NAEX_01264 [Nannocystis exedens]SFE68485.1 hypothetical protein SAMN02745121_05178 [Nannocystis exedens]